MFPGNTSDTPKDPRPVATPVSGRYDGPPATTDLLKRRSKIAAWTLVSNVLYYTLPVFAIGLYVTAVGLHWVDPNLASGQSQLIVVGFAFFGAGTLLGVLTIILDSIYLAKMKPVGRSNALVNMSLTLCSVATVLAIMLVMFSIGLSGAMS